MNHLRSLPRSVFSLSSSLTILQIDNNSLTELPSAIGQLRKLTTLTASHNKLASIPESLARLTMLEELDLSNNQLSTIPSAIFPALQNLRECYFADNQLTDLPADIGAAQLLEILDVSNVRVNCWKEKKFLTICHFRTPSRACPTVHHFNFLPCLLTPSFRTRSVVAT